MHCVKRPVAGISTVSTDSPSSRPMSSFCVPSDDFETSSVFVFVIGNSTLSCSRKSFGSVVAWSQSVM